MDTDRLKKRLANITWQEILELQKEREKVIEELNGKRKFRELALYYAMPKSDSDPNSSSEATTNI